MPALSDFLTMFHLATANIPAVVWVVTTTRSVPAEFQGHVETSLGQRHRLLNVFGKLEEPLPVLFVDEGLDDFRDVVVDRVGAHGVELLLVGDHSVVPELHHVHVRVASSPEGE